jgi:bifunctional oligoribonuclease and PAP phosphatase NrnA
MTPLSRVAAAPARLRVDDRFTGEDLDRALALLANARSVLLLGHVNPDADALGSALALGLALARRDVRVQVAFGDPGPVPRSLAALPGAELIVPEGERPAVPELVVTLDVNSRSRLGGTAALLDETPRVLVIDHHASNTRFGTDHLVIPAAESTTAVVATVLAALQVPVDKDIADNLYAGLATDTVGFRHATGAAHLLAAQLLDAGVQPDQLLRPITDTHPFGWLHMLATVLERAELVDAGRSGTVIWTSVGLEDAQGLQSEELDSVIDIVRTTVNTTVAAVFKQTAPDQWQVSLRSLPGVDVARVAVALGGGGHVRAAGFGFDGTLADAKTALLQQLSA